MIGVIDGLHYLHRDRHFVHGSLSMECIYVKEGRPVIGGLFALLSPTLETSPVYTAPEVYEDVLCYDSDIFSAGVIFLEIAIGRRVSPEEVPTLQQLAQQVIDEHLRTIILSMINTDPSCRLTTAKLIELLESNTANTLTSNSTAVDILFDRTEQFWHHKCSADKIEQGYRQFRSAIEM